MRCSADRKMGARYKDQFLKTQLCPWYKQGRCNRPLTCRFAHDESELRAPPDLSRTAFCPRLMKVGWCDEPTCPYAHSQKELRATKHFLKTSMCQMWLSGSCPSGIRCRFAHGAEELRKNSSPSNDVSPKHREVPLKDPEGSSNNLLAIQQNLQSLNVNSLASLMNLNLSLSNCIPPPQHNPHTMTTQQQAQAALMTNQLYQQQLQQYAKLMLQNAAVANNTLSQLQAGTYTNPNTSQAQAQAAALTAAAAAYQANPGLLLNGQPNATPNPPVIINGQPNGNAPLLLSGQTTIPGLQNYVPQYPLPGPEQLAAALSQQQGAHQGTSPSEAAKGGQTPHKSPLVPFFAGVGGQQVPEGAGMFQLPDLTQSWMGAHQGQTILQNALEASFKSQHSTYAATNGVVPQQEGTPTANGYVPSYHTGYPAQHSGYGMPPQHTSWSAHQGSTVTPMSGGGWTNGTTTDRSYSDGTNKGGEDGTDTNNGSPSRTSTVQYPAHPPNGPGGGVPHSVSGHISTSPSSEGSPINRGGLTFNSVLLPEIFPANKSFPTFLGGVGGHAKSGSDDTTVDGATPNGTPVGEGTEETSAETPEHDEDHERHFKHFDAIGQELVKGIDAQN
ncbi:unnamed protein product [Vitrella brassicaformis CCMP3155]|uniref:C3H1-type domain-containing protein n=2 Tax=Vitrella brassicaformis TaxID=1169539 RepID=A0A0G4EHJ0_VITBC|nr:unnamed protein product [Vitrella brassicaformis CCMP3155]|eukprot:CEL95448.1 unnamed protein product [Vitrella brassicaformis CCMP3155]